MDNDLVSTQDTSDMMAAESNRSVAEIQGQMVMARKFPRSHSIYSAKITEACQRKALASQAAYSYPRGGAMVTGPSIRLAEVLAQSYGNLDFGVREISQKKGESLVQSFCYDLETNVRQQKVFTVKHERYSKKKGISRLTDPRDIYEHIANQGARRLRACILGIIPGDVIDSALAVCDKTNSGQGKVPLKDKIASMISVFKEMAVTVEMLEKRLQHNIDATDWAEINSLGKIYNSLKDGMGKRQDFFELPNSEKQKSEETESFKESLNKKEDSIKIKMNQKDNSFSIPKGNAEKELEAKIAEEKTRAKQ